VRWALATLKSAAGPVVAIAAGLLPRADDLRDTRHGQHGKADTRLQELFQPDDITLVVTAAPSLATPTTKGAAVFTTELFRLGTDVLPYAPELVKLSENWQQAPRALDIVLPYLPLYRVLSDATVADAFDRYYPSPSTEPPAQSDSVRHRADFKLVRHIARAAVKRGEPLDRAISDLPAWLLDLLPSGDRAPVARYLAGVYDKREDLRGTFQYVPGASARDLAQWALAFGVKDDAFDYDLDLLGRAAAATLAAQPVLEQPGTQRPEGVNLIGYLSGELGMGTSVRLLDQALVAAGIPTSNYPVTTSLANRAAADYRATDNIRYDISLIHVNSPYLADVCGVLADVVNDSYRIAMWSWETEDFPPSQFAGFPYADEIWTSSDFMTAAIAPHSPVPVFTVPPPLPQPYAGQRPPTPTGLGVPTDGRPWFLFVFDYLSTPERKNPWGLVEAFCRAFPIPTDDGPVLVIKTINAKKRQTESSYLHQITRTRPDIVIIDKYLAEEELMGLMANCTAYVSLHRAEGYGLTIAEAMAWGRPVIVSDYSGNLQFNTPENSYLVPCQIVPIPYGAEPYTPGTPWGDPDLDAAAKFMRQVVADPAAAAAVGARAEQDIRELHNADVAGRHLASVLADARLRAAPILQQRRTAAAQIRAKAIRDARLREVRKRISTLVKRG